MKRILDTCAALAGLTVASPLLLIITIVIWLQDFHSPFYVAPRMARGGGTFRMVKLRSMVVQADKKGGVSTSATDRRITPVGRFVRAYKVDEVMQLWNVLKGDMSLVGPRPQVYKDAALYSEEEKRMLTVLPGISDMASIVFSDEGEILKSSANPDLLYNQIIRPWKSRLALLYIDKQTFLLDLRLILLTAVALVSRRAALDRIQKLLRAWGADPLLIKMARRQERLIAYPPPGANEIVESCV
jgi:lipopolysaccharide/colanic/teichoic acid biosynthesis glycosyltransferase